MSNHETENIEIKMLTLELTNQFESDLLLDILMENGIRAIVEENSDKAFGGAAHGKNAWGKIYVDESDFETVKGFLAEIRSDKVNVDFDETLDVDAIEAIDK